MNRSDTVYDAIVIGSGAAGSWAAKDLTEGGLTVLLLEAGRAMDSELDFPEGEPPVAMGTLQRVAAGLAGQHVQARCGLLMEGTKQFFVNDRENPYTAPFDKPFCWIRGRQLGGRLLTWGRHSPRMSKFEFKAASLRGEGVDWPVSYEDMSPHYDRVEMALGLYGTNDGIANAPDGRYVGPGATTKVERAFRVNVEQRLPHVRVGHGRYLRYDSGAVPFPIRIALATGRLEIRTDAIASRLLIDPTSGKASGVEYVDRLKRSTHAVRGKVVVVCASAFESVRILLNSQCQRHPLGVGGSSGHLGRYVCDHVTYVLNGRLDEEHVEPIAKKGAYDFGGSGLYIPSFCEQEQRDFRGRYGIQVMIGAGGPSWVMFAHGEMQPRYENRVSIDPFVKDSWGIPSVRIECNHSENDIKMVEHMRKRLPEIARAGGLDADVSLKQQGGILYKMLSSFAFTKYDALWPGMAVHEMGGARMGDKQEDSVLNSYCQCWDADNVFVTDASSFAYPGFQNPTLTSMALTSRACQYIVRHYSSELG